MPPINKRPEVASRTYSASEDELTALAARLVKDLGAFSPGEPFCLWLKGDLGTGKTTLAGFILRALGLDPALPVTSPTYTYMNEYQIHGKWFAHLDLYRAGTRFSLEDLGLTGFREYQGYLVEWPEQIPADPVLRPTHVLTISIVGSGGRLYHLSSPGASAKD